MALPLIFSPAPTQLPKLELPPAIVQVVQQAPQVPFPDRTAQYQAAIIIDQQQAAIAAEKALENRLISRVAPSGTYSSNYAWGNCTSYVASRIQVPDSLGNANSWGYALGYNPRPLVGAIAWTTQGWAGHVAIVEQVFGDMVEVSEMNYNGLDVVDNRWTTTNDWSGFIY